MRVASYNRYEAAVDSLQRRQQELGQTQQQMTTGKRIAKPSDDPSGLARAERAYLTGERIAAQQRSVDASRNAMRLAESTLGQANDVLQGARETVVASGNGSYTVGERLAQVAQLRSLRSQLLGLANQSDGAGGFVFGGQGATSAPFVDAPGGVQSTNSPGAMLLDSREGLPMTVDGAAVWLAAPTGNGSFVTAPAAGNTGASWITPGAVTDPSALTGGNYELQFSVTGGGTTFSVLKDGLPTALSGEPFRAGGAIEIDGMSFNISGTPADGDRYNVTPSRRTMDPFEALDGVIAVLSDPRASDAQVSQAVAFGLRDLDNVMGKMQSARAEAGAVLTRLDAVDQRNQDRALWATTVQSDAEDLDMVQAISNFQNQQAGYQAALQTYATVQRMSLFDYFK